MCCFSTSPPTTSTSSPSNGSSSSLHSFVECCRPRELSTVYLSNVSNRTLEISCGRVIDYKVKYNEYVVLRKESREQQIRSLREPAEGDGRHEGVLLSVPLSGHQGRRCSRRLEQLGEDRAHRDRLDRQLMMYLEVSALLALWRLSRHLRRGAQGLWCSHRLHHVTSPSRGREGGLRRQEQRRKVYTRKMYHGRDSLSRAIWKISHNIQIGYFAPESQRHSCWTRT